MQPNVISALARLQRAGSENSATTRKLIEAACTSGETIARLMVEGEIALIKTKTPSPQGATHLMPSDLDLTENTRVILFAWCERRGIREKLGTGVDVSRASALWLAEEVAAGLLDRITEEAEKASSQSSQALDQLRSMQFQLTR